MGLRFVSAKESNMLVKVIIKPDGTRTHEVIERAQGEQCTRISELNTEGMVSEEITGPDCDSAQEGEF